MTVPQWLWVATIVAILALFVVDLIVVDAGGREAKGFTTTAATRWVIFYIALAALFGLGLWRFYGSEYAGQFAAGYITEYSLSIDNLFVFLVIMSSFAVPAAYQHRVLLIGVLIALVLRGLLIAVGAAVLARFSWAFFLFGAFLLATAWKVWRDADAEPDPDGNALVRWVERHLPATNEYHGHQLTVKIDGKRLITPMLLVMLAIGTTDLLFALDSIPAVFGLTKEAYIVFTANAFALMGLRQLYFLLHGLLGKLIYLAKGLAIILAFIGVKLVLEALHGQGLHVPVPGIALSLGFIVTVLAATAALSLWAVARHPELASSSDEALAEAEAAEEYGEALERLPPEDKT